MGEQTSEGSDGEPRLGADQTEPMTTSGETGGRPEVDPAVIDLRSAPEPAASPSESPSGAVASGPLGLAPPPGHVARPGGRRAPAGVVRIRARSRAGGGADRRARRDERAVARRSPGARRPTRPPDGDRRPGPPSVTHHLAVHTLEPSGWPTALARAVDLVEISRPTPISRAGVGGGAAEHPTCRTSARSCWPTREGSVPAWATRSTACGWPAGGCGACWPPIGPGCQGAAASACAPSCAELAEGLGRARDTDVLYQRLGQEIAALPEELVVGPVAGPCRPPAAGSSAGRLRGHLGRSGRRAATS